MKKNVLFFLFLTIFCFILTDEIFAEYVWTQYNNSTGYNINSIKFNESFGVMVGDNGIIKTSSNDGLTWINQNSGCEERLNDVFIENNNLIVAVGSNRRVLISQDSGVTWINRPPVNVSGTTEFYSVSVNNSVIWITGSSSLIFKSSDFGQTWEKQYEGSRDIKFIKIFSSGNHGVSIGENILLTTSDGGSNWLPVIPITGTLNFTTGFCLNDYLWFGITNNGDGTYSLYQTFEGPSRWIFLYKFDFAVKSITFINYYSGFAVGENGNIYYTQDNPSIWQKIDIDTSITVNLNSVSFTDSGETIWVSGNNGYYYKRFYEYGELEPQTQEIIADAGGKYFVLKNDTVQLTSEKTIARNKNFLRYSWSAEDADVILSDQDKILCNFESGTSGKYRIKLKVDDYRGHFGEDYAEIYVVDTYSQISSPFSEISVTGNNTGLMLNDYVHTIDLKLESVTSVYNASLYFDLKNFRSVPHLFIANKIEPSFFNEVRPNISLFDDLSYTAVNFELFDFNTSNHISGLSEAFNNLKLKYRLPSGVNKFNGRLFAIFQYNEELRQWHQISPSYQYNILSGIEVEIQISHFSIYGLFAIPYFEQSGDVEIYPNPFIAGDRNFKTGRNYTGTDDGSGIYFAGSNLKNANVKIVNLAGYVVNEFNTGGESYFQWDVFDRKGRPVSSGLYYVIIETGNYKCVKKLQIIR